MRKIFALLWSRVIFENIQGSSEDFRSFSEAFLTLPKTPKDIPANSHACGLKTSISRPLTPAGQFLTPDWKMWVVAVIIQSLFGIVFFEIELNFGY